MSHLQTLCHFRTDPCGLAYCIAAASAVLWPLLVQIAARALYFSAERLPWPTHLLDDAQATYVGRDSGLATTCRNCLPPIPARPMELFVANIWR